MSSSLFNLRFLLNLLGFDRVDEYLQGDEGIKQFVCKIGIFLSLIFDLTKDCNFESGLI